MYFHFATRKILIKSGKVQSTIPLVKDREVTEYLEG